MIPYALFNSKIIFEPFQYKPFFKFFKHTDRDLYIADEVGVGKTIEAGIIISELIFGDRKNQWIKDSLDDVLSPHILILAPTALCSQWKEELESKFMLRVYDAYSTCLGMNYNAQIVVYAESWQQLEKIENDDMYYDLLIVDEAHNFRNTYTEDPFTQERTKSRRYESLKKICSRSKRKIFMSATPIFNKQADFKNEINLLSETYSITASTKAVSKCLDFQPRIESVLVNLNPAEESLYWAIKNESSINSLTKSSVYLHEGCSSMPCLAKTLLQPPGKYIMDAFKQFEVSEDEEATAQLEQILSLIEQKKNDALREMLYKEKNTKIKGILTMLLEKDKFRKYAEEYMSEKDNYNDSKLEKLDQIIVQKLTEDDGYVMKKKHLIVFSHYIATCNYIYEHFYDTRPDGTRLFIATGENTKQEIDASISEFKETCKEDKYDSILICSDVCREGKNMQECQVLVNYDIPFSPSIMQQRIGRIDRNGQKYTPIVYNLLCNVDNDIHTYYEIIFEKIRLINGTKGICGIDVIRETNKNVQEQIMEEWVKTAQKHQKDYNNTYSALQNAYLKYLRQEKQRLKLAEIKDTFLKDEIEKVENYTDEEIKHKIREVLFVMPNTELKNIRENEHCIGKDEVARDLFGLEADSADSVRELLVNYIEKCLEGYRRKEIMEYKPESDTYMIDISGIKERFVQEIIDKQLFEQFSNLENKESIYGISDMYFDGAEIAFGTAVYKEVGILTEATGRSLTEFEECVGEKFENCFIPLSPLCEVLDNCI